MRQYGELNVPGAPGNNWVGSSTPVVNIGYGGQQGLISHGQHTTDSFVDGVPRYFPGSHDPRQHNPLVDPAGNFIPGTAKPDSEIPLSLGPTNIPGSSVGNMAGLSETMSGQSAAKKEAYIRALEGQKMPNNPIDWLKARKIRA